jgi:hypothetical protein
MNISPLMVNNPALLLSKSPIELNPAQWMYERLAKQMIDFEKELTLDEEIGGRLVAAPSDGAFHIEDLGFLGPDMIIFYGKNKHGRPVQLLQHYSQLSVLLTALPKESTPPRRIGFNLEQKLTDKEKASK